MEKSAGLLLHISELPSKYGIGSFGIEAKRFVKLLKLAGQKYWQVLPLNPVGEGNSPYSSSCSSALDPYFIDLDLLEKDGFLTKEEITNNSKKNTGRVDYEYLSSHRYNLLFLASKRLLQSKTKTKVYNFYKRNKKWLKDYALFNILTDIYHTEWSSWPMNYRKHKNKDLEELIKNKQEEFNCYVTMQYLAYNQYLKLKKYANKNGVRMVGDLPIYVSYNSSDVWAHQNDFMLAKCGKPLFISGMPADDMCKDGQVWGMPTYNYDYMRKNGFKWWKSRICQTSKLYDLLRLDHFIGFAEYYAIPYATCLAKDGKWMKGPGTELIDIIINYSKADLFAEDLGYLSKNVIDLLNYSKIAGTKIFEYGFNSDKNNPHIPNNYPYNAIAYLGNHDNDVFKNFIITHPNDEKNIRDYLNISIYDDIIEESIENLFASKAKITILMVQDLLKMGKESRINVPGTLSKNNWSFRFKKSDFKKERFLELFELTCKYQRY